MNAVLWTYVLYGVAALILTAVLARTLYDNGRTFLESVFADDKRLAKSINTLLVIGFYMCNLGYALLIFRVDEGATSGELAAALVSKLGLLLVSLGVMHFVNMAVIWKIRQNAEYGRVVPATATTMVPPPPVAENWITGPAGY